MLRVSQRCRVLSSISASSLCNFEQPCARMQRQRTLALWLHQQELLRRGFHRSTNVSFSRIRTSSFLTPNDDSSHQSRKAQQSATSGRQLQGLQEVSDLLSRGYQENFSRATVLRASRRNYHGTLFRLEDEEGMSAKEKKKALKAKAKAAAAAAAEAAEKEEGDDSADAKKEALKAKLAAKKAATEEDPPAAEEAKPEASDNPPPKDGSRPSVPIEYSTEELARDAAKHKAGLEDPDVPDFQNPLHHNNPDYERESREDFDSEEEFQAAVLPIPPLELDPDKVTAPPHLHELADEIVNLTMLEMNELINRMSNHYGFHDGMLSPDGDAVDDDAAGDEGAAAAEAKTAFDIKLVEFDAKAKIKVIKEVRGLAGLGLKEAKEMVEGAPKVVMKDVKKEEAEEIKAKLEGLGATIELV